MIQKAAKALNMDSDSQLQSELLNQILSLEKNNNIEEKTKFFYSQISLLEDFSPRDGFERLLVIQMLGAHKLAMECFKSTQLQKDPQVANMKLNQANKLLRTYAAQLEALNKHRGKGQQKMTVEHVHVNKGGKAIIGPISPLKKDKGGE